MHSNVLDIPAVTADVSDELLLSLVSIQSDWPVGIHLVVRVHIYRLQGRRPVGLVVFSFVIRLVILILVYFELVRISLSVAVHEVFDVLFGNSVEPVVVFGLEVVDQLQAVLQVHFVFHRDLVHLLQDGSHIVDLAQLDQERDVLVQAAVFLVFVP